MRKPVDRHPTVSLTLMIGTQSYRVEPIRPDAFLRVGVQAYDLIKGDGEVYTVACGPTGFACTCPDFIFRKAAAESYCKHIRACNISGLVTIQADRTDENLHRHL